MTNFKVNEIAFYSGQDFDFAPCYCIIVNTNDVITDTQEEEGHYLFLPLIADRILHADPAFEGWVAWPHQLSKLTISLQPETPRIQVEGSGPVEHHEPDEVAPEDDRETNLPRLNDAFTEMLDQVFVSRGSNEYLSCDGVDCDSCPFNEDPGCGVVHLEKALKIMQGYKKFM